MTYTAYEEFAGWGGSGQGINAVPGMNVGLAANHKKIATEVYGLNHPGADIYLGDIAKADIATFPPSDFFWASPSCPAWTNARGVKRNFDQANQGAMFEDNDVGVRQDEAAARRSRALMEEIPRYLTAMHLKGKPVLAGVVENVIECRKWSDWKRWRDEFHSLGYKTWLIALNAAHVTGPKTGRVPQSRDRLFLGYSLEKLGRNPDWDKWLRPWCWCPRCENWVAGVQRWKRAGVDMGRYGIRSGSYVYRCPRTTCRADVVHPDVLPALQAIDLNLNPGHTIGERMNGIGKKLEEATLHRIRVGWQKFGRPMLSPAGGTWRDAAVPLDIPMPARTTRDCDGVVLPPGALTIPFIAELRGGGSRNSARAVTDPLARCDETGAPLTDGMSPPTTPRPWPCSG